MDEVLAFHRNMGLSGHWLHLVDAPYETAIAMLYEQKAVQTVHPVYVCSTESAASNYPGLDIHRFLLR